ncbi:hypothetical protein [Alkalihalobacterium sp. APHAB7]|uniref:hypothetical protein n=1 Tax=Alkalihalobacterium sp. APHAB7 TaxID=3402081 RepID=UPI003AAE3F89
MVSSIFLNRVKRCEKIEVLIDEMYILARIIIEENYKEGELLELLSKVYLLSQRAKELHETKVILK